MSEAALRPAVFNSNPGEAPLGLVIFDCDGVLIDSEPVSRGVIAEEANRLGWPMIANEAKLFTGLRWSDLQPIFERELGRALPDKWPLQLQNRLMVAMADRIDAVPGAGDVLRATAALGLPYRIASNSSHEEMAEKFGRTGLAPLVAGRVHSARDVGRGKPWPDLFLAVAAIQGIAPSACIVVEDSAPGIAAAEAAGMRCIAFAPDEPVPGPHILGAYAVVRSLAELPALFNAAMLERAA